MIPLQNCGRGLTLASFPQRGLDLHQRSRRPGQAIQLRHMWLWVTSVIGLDLLRSHDLCHYRAWLVFRHAEFVKTVQGRSR